MMHYKTFIQYLLLISAVIFLPESLTAQQNESSKKLTVEQKSGKAMIMQFKNPATSDSLRAKGIQLSKQEAKKFEGQ